MKTYINSQRIKVLLELGFFEAKENDKYLFLEKEGLEQFIQIQKDNGNVQWINMNYELDSGGSSPLNNDDDKKKVSEGQAQQPAFERHSNTEISKYNFPRRL